MLIKFIIEDYQEESVWDTLQVCQEQEDDDIIVCLQDMFGMDSETAVYFAEEAEAFKSEKIMIKRNNRKVVGSIQCL